MNHPAIAGEDFRLLTPIKLKLKGSLHGVRYDNAVLLHGQERVHYRKEGVGEPALVLLHGFSAHSGSWRKVLPGFSKTRMVVAPTLPVARESLGELAMKHVEAVGAILNHLNVKRFSLIGNSFGGLEAMMLAAERSRDVCSVVLEDSAGADYADVLKEYSSLQIPTLLIWGKKDGIIPLDTAKTFKNAIRDSVLVVMDAGHVPHWEMPEEFIFYVSRFLDERKC